METLPYMLHKESTKFLRAHFVLWNDIIKGDALICLGTYQGCQTVLHQNLRSGLTCEYQDLLAVAIDMQLTTSDNSCQFVVSL